MARHYTEAENLAWHNALPAKRVGAMVALRNPTGQLLLVQPNYKPGWSMVGGVVDEGEPPLAAALREVQEEVGLTLEPERLSFLGLLYRPPNGERLDILTVIFGATLTAAEVDAIVLQDSELEDSIFMNLDDPALTTMRVSIRAVAGLHQSSLTTGYFEDDQLLIPAT